MSSIPAGAARDFRGWTAGRLAVPATLVAFVAILAWTSLVSIPTFRFDDADDAFFVEVAHLWTRGLPPYVASFDIKGVGFFAALALAVNALGATLATLKIVAILSSAVAATLLYRLCARYDRPAAIVCAALYPILTIISGDAAYQFLNVFLLIALSAALAAGPSRTRAIVAGLALGGACAVKQTCAIDGLALLYILCSEGRDATPRWRLALTFAASAALAPLAFLGLYVAIGAAGVFVHDLVAVALERGATIPWSSTPRWFLEWILPLSGLALISAFAAAKASERPSRAPVAPLFAWLVVEVVGILAQHGGYRTAMVPLIAPMLLLSTIFVSETYAPRGPVRRNVALGVFGVLVFAQAMLGYGDTILRKMTVVDPGALRETAAAIAATGPRPEDRLFVLNGPVWPNIATELAPPTPVFHWGHLMCDFPGAGLPALVANFAAAPRYVVFENANRRLDCQKEATTRVIERELDAHYREIAAGRSGAAAWRAYERTR